MAIDLLTQAHFNGRVPAEEGDGVAYSGGRSLISSSKEREALRHDLHRVQQLLCIPAKAFITCDSTVSLLQRLSCC
jgi:hypothetical protein